jgi:hypothetical protein
MGQTVSSRVLVFGSLQHGHLMAQRDDLGLHGGASPKANEKGIEQN